MTSQIARLAIVALAFIILSSTAARAANSQVLPPPALSAPEGSPQWTFKVDISVDHIPPKLVAVGASCVVWGPGAITLATGATWQPLTAGAYVGTVIVPAFLKNGELAGEARSWTCALYFRDRLGGFINAGGMDPAAQPRESTPQHLRLDGTFP